MGNALHRESPLKEHTMTPEQIVEVLKSRGWTAEIVEKSRGTSKAHAIRMSLNEIIRELPPDLSY